MGGTDATHSPALRFGAELRRSRRARGWSQTDLGARMGYSGGLLSYVERGKKPVSRNLAVRADEVFETGGLFHELWRRVAHSSFLEGFDEFAEAEARCVRLRAFEMDVVLGIFMTPEYLAALEQGNVRRGRITQEQADGRVARNVERQRILHRTPAASVHAVLDESCLRRPIGGRAVMDAQLAHLEELSDLPNVTLQIAPFELAEARPFACPMMLLNMPNHVVLGYSECQARGYVERGRDTLAAWESDYDRLQVESMSTAATLARIRVLRKEL
ncbi:Scr1 family TA system antitoxin-like transcriptional regulator [Kitasatospora phosalacinea]|uniref:Scr1 family TA system antitoxin-like transcriptional regulator n=1 Tax=Kitasatospora phosalacinea TaxID=2065 RepID=A0ABW6GN70_9ACTN